METFLEETREEHINQFIFKKFISGLSFSSDIDLSYKLCFLSLLSPRFL